MKPSNIMISRDGAVKVMDFGLARMADSARPTAAGSVVGFALSLEDPNELLNYLILSRIYGYSGDYWDRYPTKIMEVTAEEVQRVTQKYLNPDRLQIVAAGDAKKILPAMRKFGPTKIYDSEGNPPVKPTTTSPRPIVLSSNRP